MRILSHLILVNLCLLNCQTLLAQPGRFRGPAGPRIEPEDLTPDLGSAAIPDRETFDKMSYRGEEVGRDGYLANLQFVKFCIDKANPATPKIYFMNTKGCVIFNRTRFNLF